MVVDGENLNPHIRRGEPNARPWEDIEGSLRAIDREPMVELVADIRRRGLDRALFGQVGVMGLAIDMAPLVWGEPQLLIACISNETQACRFTFQWSGPKPQDWWTADYPREQVIPAFYRFITRMGWFAKDHPMLKGVSYE